MSGTLLALLENGTKDRPTPELFADLVNRKRGDGGEYPVITEYDV